VRTYWSPDAVERVTGHKLTGKSENGLLHLIQFRRGDARWTGQQSRDGKAAMKPFWEISKEEAAKCLQVTSWPSAVYEYFRGGGFHRVPLARRDADDHVPHQPW